MKRFMSLILALVVVAGTGLASFAADTIGTIDHEKLIRSYHKAQLFSEDMKSREVDLEKMKAEFLKQIREAKAKNQNNPLQVEQLQKSLEEKFQVKVNELRTFQESQAQVLESEVTNAINTVAKSRNLSVILSKNTVLSGGVDITNEVLSRLNAGGSK